MSVDKNDSQDYYKERKRYRGGAWFAILLIIVGIVFLLNNFGVLPWKIWQTLILFWPFILILWGLQFILGKSFLANLIVTIIGFILIGFALIYSIASVNPAFSQALRLQFPWWSFVEMLNYKASLQDFK